MISIAFWFLIGSGICIALMILVSVFAMISDKRERKQATKWVREFACILEKEQEKSAKVWCNWINEQWRKEDNKILRGKL